MNNQFKQINIQISPFVIITANPPSTKKNNNQLHKHLIHTYILILSKVTLSLTDDEKIHFVSKLFLSADCLSEAGGGGCVGRKAQPSLMLGGVPPEAEEELCSLL